MQATNIWMTDKWIDEISEPSQAFLNDIRVLAIKVKREYAKLGLEVRLTYDNGVLECAHGITNPTFGFITINKIFMLKVGSPSAYCCGQLARHMVTIYEIFLLLEKYGYADRIDAFRHPYDDQFDVETNAQTELMNLQLI